MYACMHTLQVPSLGLDFAPVQSVVPYSSHFKVLVLTTTILPDSLLKQRFDLFIMLLVVWNIVKM